MTTITSLRATSLSRHQLGDVLKDYLALDRVRGLRRLLVVRCGLLAVVVAAAEAMVHGFSAAARVLSFALPLVPPVWAWAHEIALEHRLTRRLESLEAGAVRTVSPPDPGSGRAA